MINEEVLGPQLLISAYRLSVRTANQSRLSDSWFVKNVAWVDGGEEEVEEVEEVVLYLISVRSQLHHSTFVHLQLVC